MNLMSRIPTAFYKLFGSKYTEQYILFLVAIYEAVSRSYSSLGLTEEECRIVMNEKISESMLLWDDEKIDEEGVFLTRANMAGVCLRHFEEWGWLKRDFDETLNSYVVSFPEYSQLYIEVFQKMLDENSNKERESVLTVYSHLYTYSADREKNIEILKSAFQTSRSLVQMLVNMQESMRGYFDELSRQKSLHEIQEVLVREINNSDSQRYTILTTTDSFYRYKEAVKELIDQNISENESRMEKLQSKRAELEQDSRKRYRIDREIALCDEAMELLLKIEREFDAIERRYNKLIEQKTIFATRAAARMRYMLQEGTIEEDQTVLFVNLLNNSGKREEILEEFADRMQLTTQYGVITEKSFYRQREKEKEKFTPQAVSESLEKQSEDLDTFIIKPLYTQREIQEFRKRNEQDGCFCVTENTVQTMEDLEKLFFVWQEATEHADASKEITIGDEVMTASGFRYSILKIEEN